MIESIFSLCCESPKVRREVKLKVLLRTLRDKYPMKISKSIFSMPFAKSLIPLRRNRNDIMSRFRTHIPIPLQESPTELKRHTSILAEYRTLCLPIFVDRSCLNLPPGFFGYCDVVLLAEALHSRHPFVLGTAKKALHARYPADAIIGPCQPCLRAHLGYP